MLQQERSYTTTNATDGGGGGGGGGIWEELNKRIHKASKTDGAGGDRISCNASNKF